MKALGHDSHSAAGFASALLAATTMVLLGCGGDSGAPEQEDTLYAPASAPEVVAGFYVAGRYDPLEPGDGCPIVHGLQGGTWIMPAVRIRGMSSPALVEGSLTTSGGEVVGFLDREQRFVLSGGWLEIEALPILVEREPPNEELPVEDLFGLDAALELTVTDAEHRSDHFSVAVVLQEG